MKFVEATVARFFRIVNKQQEYKKSHSMASAKFEYMMEDAIFMTLY